jgi:nuclear pore complex protein Nup98-Nup96
MHIIQTPTNVLYSGGGFGSNTNTTFGSKPFGGSTGGGLFGGGSTSGSTFGGFGATANNNTAPAFGSGNTGAGIFGQNKTGFGSTTTGTGTTGLFGGGSTGGGFGSTTTNAFGGGATSGFGAGAAGQPPPNNGTASVPFSAFQEKDAGGQQQFQTITFQQPYQHYSLEELRLADYNQGRRYGNSNGQAGAFGQSTGFGGFGSTANTGATGFGANTNANTGGGLFGGSTNTTTLFGQTGTTTSFGSNNNATGGGLFGQNKPAGGLFGNTSTTQPATGGGLFGNTGTNTGTGFGTGGTTGFGSSTTTGGGLFGQQNQTQNKPAFGGFGSGTTTTTPAFGANTGTTGGFGTNTGTGGGLFGQQNQTTTAPAFGGAQPAAGTGGGLFGGGAATGTGTGGGLFGQSQQNQTQAQPAGGLFGGGGFGQNNQQNQQKPGGLFGGSTTTTGGGGLFGQTNQTQPAGGLFGQNQQNQNQGSSLFGNKPATTGGGLFGGSTTNTNTGGGLFGNLSNNTNQQNTGSTLFGNTQNQQKPGGLFGGQSATNTTGGGLFGNQAQNNTSTLGGSLFGGQNQQQQTQQPLNNSLFGASGNSGSLLQTSMNTNPYGNDALFAGLATPTASPGPLATPLSSSQKNRKSAILPQHKLNPSASTRLLTPQNKRAGGYGFTYSTYGTPSSASASSSPNFGSSLFGNGSLSRSLGKSLSTSNLRNSYTPETSILAPGAFSTNGRSTGSSSLKKLNINRSINTRVPLFDEPSTEKKRVSFAQPSDGADRNGADHITPESGALVRTEPEENSRENGVSSSSSTTVNGDAPNGHASEPEMSQVNGKQLTTVSEEPLAPRTSSSLNKQGGTVVDPTPGQYWSKPSMDELRKMNRSELSKVQDFVVGRDRIGEIQFNPGGTVDLTGVDLDKLFGDIVQLNIRNATVYGETTTVPKPARGTGLNHFSRITLGNSWPRNKAGKKDQKHLERLKRVAGTTFEEYRPQTGEWIFTVPHFSSYGLDYEGDVYDDEEEEEEEGEGDSSELSSLPDTPAQHRSSQMTITGTPQKESSASPTESSPDDTFDFIRGQRRRASVPGGYGNEVAYEEDVTDDTMDTTGGESFLGERSVGSLDGQQDADYTEESESESVEDQDMAGPVSAPVRTTEQPSAYPNLPKSILKNSQILRPGLGTPSKGPLVFDDDWANQLQRTISPKKQDRHALRENQSEVLRETDGNIPKFGQSTNGQSIFTRRGLMESLFGDADKSQDSVSKRTGSGFEV